ncbi:2OG-Fe(II) oxygenase [Nocardia terpenica]|uniref:2OG-Fe(II) oxygenase n=1 Tax=Nocardia terpenica TaxID=455432 RepID=UPI0018E08922|nr:2OG-Fe(II) oxygenase [Nocardia terpenica]
MIKKKEADARAPEGSVGARRVGFVRLRRALRRSEWNLPPLPPEAEPRWQSSFVETAVDPDVARLRLEDFGYGEREIRALGKSRDLWAYSAPHRLLTTEGVAAFRTVCEALADRAPDDDYIVSRRVRNATSMSRFINEMMHDEGLLCRVSAIAGVPLVPHPLVNPGVCINYFDDKKVRINKVEESQVAKWHYDGMTYVFVMQLAQPTEFTGGELLIYQGHRDRFQKEKNAVTTNAAAHPQVFRAPFTAMGDTVYTRGSAIWHAVTPVTTGRRISAVLSFWCPLLPHDDTNEFWHIAAEDGLLPSLSGFVRLRRAQQDALGYCRRTGVDLAPVSAAAVIRSQTS